MPEYYTEKVNLFIGLAPVAITAGVSSVSTSLLKGTIGELIKYIVIDYFGYRDWFAPLPRAVEIVSMLCGFFPSACQTVA